MPEPESQDDPLLRAITGFRAELDRLLDAEVSRLSRGAGRAGSSVRSEPPGPLEEPRPSASTVRAPSPPTASALDPRGPEGTGPRLPTRPRPSPAEAPAQAIEGDSVDAGQRLDALARRLQGQARRTQSQRQELPPSTSGSSPDPGSAGVPPAPERAGRPRSLEQ